MSTRTDALLSQQETGKITASIVPCYGRLSPGASRPTSNSRNGSAPCQTPLRNQLRWPHVAELHSAADHKDPTMFMRIDRLQVPLPEPKKPNPNAAAALQELLGGKYGEMSTLGNYMFQSFNFRNKTKLRPFYSLVSAIFMEELGHVELVSNGISMLNNGPGDPTEDVDVSKAPFEDMKDIRLAGGFFSHAGGALPINSNAMSWN